MTLRNCLKSLHKKLIKVILRDISNRSYNMCVYGNIQNFGVEDKDLAMWYVKTISEIISLL